MNTFTQPITRAYDLTDATWEIIIMLLVSFILGWFFHYFWGKMNDDAQNVTSSSAIPQKYAGIANDDLKIIEGVGPKIEELLKGSAMNTWSDVASADVAQLKKVLTKGGDRFQMHDPSSWADQAALAVEGKWSELEEYQDLLIGGRTS